MPTALRLVCSTLTAATQSENPPLLMMLKDSFWPPLAMMPSEPFLKPAAVRIEMALDGLRA